jgi:hypothetical protein
MTNKKPILNWRLKDAPQEAHRGSINLLDTEPTAYQEWMASKTGNEFVVMIPHGWQFDDADAAYELGLNVTEDMRTSDFSGQSNPDCELIDEVHYEGEGYSAYVIPAMTRRVSS